MSEDQYSMKGNSESEQAVKPVIISESNDQEFIRISRPASRLPKPKETPKKTPKEKPAKATLKKKNTAQADRKTFRRSPSPSLKAAKKAKPKEEPPQPQDEDTNDQTPAKKPSSQDKTSKKIMIGVVAAVVFFILLVAGLLFYKNIMDKENTKKVAIAEASDKKRIIEERREKRLADAIQYAKIKPMENEKNFQAMLSKFKQIIKVYKGTKYVEKAKQEIEKLKELKEKKKRESIEGLKKEAAPYIEKGDYNSAFTIYKHYPSDFQDQTLKERKKLIDDLTNIRLKASLEKTEAKKKAKINAAKSAKKREDAIFSNIASLIFKSKYNDARNQLEKHAKKTAEYNQMHKILTELISIDARVMKYFKKHIGKEITLGIKGKKSKVKIKKINGKNIQGFNITSKVAIGIKFNLSDVGIKDQIKSIKIKDPAAKAIYIAINAAHRKKESVAKKYLKKAGPFSNILLKKLTK